MTSEVPDWATQIPNAPVQQPTSKAFQVSLPSADELSGMRQQLLQSILQQVVLAVQGALFPNTDAFTQLENWAKPLDDALLKIEDFLKTGNWDDLTDAWQDVLLFLFGTNVQTGSNTHTPAPAVADTVHKPQVVSNFDTSASIAGSGWASGGWSWDSAVSWQGSAGSAEVVADGTLKAIAGVLVPVQPGQTIAVGTTNDDGSAITTAPVVQWAALAAASGIPIQFQLIPYSGSQGAWVAGTSFTVAQSTSLAANQSSWLPLSPVTDPANHVAAGVYTVPGSGVTAVQARLVVDAVMTGGSVHWNNCDLVIAGGFLPTLKSDLGRLQTDAQDEAAAWLVWWQAVWTALQNDAGNIPKFIADVDAASTTLQETLDPIHADEKATITDILELFGFDTKSAQWIADMIEGPDGSTNLSGTFDNLFSQLNSSLATALNQVVTDFEGLPGVMQLLNMLGLVSKTANQSAVDTANTVANVNNRPIMGGLDDTTEANMDYLTATTAISLVAPTSRIAFVRCAQTDTKGSISFTAEQGGATPPSGLHVNLYKVDFANQQIVPVTTEAFVTSQLTIATEEMLFADAAQTPVQPNDVLGVEWQSTDSTNALTLFGRAASKPNHPIAKLPAFGATRNAGTSPPTAPIPFSDLTWSNDNLPYAGFETTSPPAPIYFPQQFPFIAATQTWTPDAWANYVDLVAVGDGGGGEGELGGATGYGGTSGRWITRTLEVGVDIAPGTVFTITVGRGGSGGPYFTAGGNGTGVTISWTDIHGTAQSITAAGGYGGNHTLGMSHNTLGYGPGPGNQDYEGFHYTGGADQYNNYPGNPPGGAGSGGSFYQYGTTGGQGKAWAVQRQT